MRRVSAALMESNRIFNARLPGEAGAQHPVGAAAMTAEIHQAKPAKQREFTLNGNCVLGADRAADAPQGKSVAIEPKQGQDRSLMV